MGQDGRSDFARIRVAGRILVMAKILLLTPQLPYPPQQGTSLRNFHLVLAMAEHNSVTILSFAEPNASTEPDPLREKCRVLPGVPIPARTAVSRIWQLLTTSRPDMYFRLRSDAFSAELASVLRGERFDIVQVEGLELAGYIPEIRIHCPTARVVLDCHNAETELQRRTAMADRSTPTRWPATLYSIIQIGRLARFERSAMGLADAVIAVSETDRARLAELSDGQAGDITVIPNTIDVAAYEQTVEVADAEKNRDLVFIGKMDYRPNVDGVLWFYDVVWPLILAERPETTWAIVGQRPHPRLSELRSAPGITIAGRVESVRTYLRGSRAYILPLRIGSGTRLKLIEAMAAGMAIVSTTVGVEGFPLENNGQVIIADTPAEMAGAVLCLLRDPALRASLGKAARAFAQRYDWREIIDPLDTLYRKLLTP